MHAVVIDGGYTAGECAHPSESVVLRGTMRVVEDADEKLPAIHTLVKKTEDEPGE